MTWERKFHNVRKDSAVSAWETVTPKLFVQTLDSNSNLWHQSRRRCLLNWFNPPQSLLNRRRHRLITTSESIGFKPPSQLSRLTEVVQFLYNSTYSRVVRPGPDVHDGADSCHQTRAKQPAQLSKCQMIVRLRSSFSNRRNNANFLCRTSFNYRLSGDFIAWPWAQCNCNCSNINQIVGQIKQRTLVLFSI